MRLAVIAFVIALILWGPSTESPSNSQLASPLPSQAPKSLDTTTVLSDLNITSEPGDRPVIVSMNAE